MVPPFKTMDSSHVLYFKKLTPDAIIPTKGSQYSVGYDLYRLSLFYCVLFMFASFCSNIDVTIPAKDRGLVKTGLVVILPPVCYGRVGLHLCTLQTQTVSL